MDHSDIDETHLAYCELCGKNSEQCSCEDEDFLKAGICIYSGKYLNACNICEHRNSNQYRSGTGSCQKKIKTVDQVLICSPCGSRASYSRRCGCYICKKCGKHFTESQHFVKCPLCGWNMRAGEQLDDDNTDADDDYYRLKGLE